MSNHYVVHLKWMQSYVSVISQLNLKCSFWVAPKKIIKKNQMEILELKRTITNNSMEKLNRFEPRGEGISEPQNRSTEVT